nr:protein FAR1-RELATED SEQUENCE 5-like [Ipomoea batatas]
MSSSSLDEDKASSSKLEEDNAAMATINGCHDNSTFSYDSVHAMEPSMEIALDNTTTDTKLWTPSCESSMTPYIGQGFDTLDEGEFFFFYFEYAAMAGFDVRRSTVK